MREGANVGPQGWCLSPAHSIYEQSETKKHRLGTPLMVGGKIYQYAHASEALAAGKLATYKYDTDAEETVTVAHPIGTREVTITAASAITADQYTDGFLVVNDGTSAGMKYRIKSHPAIASAATGAITLFDSLVLAWAIADTDIALYTPQFYVQESNTTQDETPKGIPEIAITSDYYFWLQVSGEAVCLMDESEGAAAGERLLTIGSSVAGAVETYDAAGEAIVGYSTLEGADYTDGQYEPIVLSLFG